MYRDEVVEIMTNYLNNMNRKHAEDMLVPIEQIEEMEQGTTPDFNRVNGELYDLLVEYGVIK